MNKPAGMVRIFHGEGKGKTWAALGLVMHALAAGLDVYVILFLKGNGVADELCRLEQYLPDLKLDYYGRHCPYIDLKLQRLLNCDDCRECFVLPGGIKDLDREFARMALDNARQAVLGGSDLVVLDEILLAEEVGLVEEREILDLIATRHPATELVLTGKRAPEAILARAQMVTRMEVGKPPTGREALGADR